MTAQKTSEELYNIPIVSSTGLDVNLEPYKNQVLLIVNVASRCGFTPQYAELESLYQDYKERGFSVLGFPCNQFLNQEPGTNEDIRNFTTSCYKVTFPLFGKIDVKGKEQAPLYSYLRKHIEKKPWKFIPWNFTKILVNTQGQILQRFLPTTSFKILRKEIESLLPT
ncbi:MAG: glutathione peroxidase [Tatlockia sp.]|nr:glutathione peroxidase [Tatlockia sp.]